MNTTPQPVVIGVDGSPGTAGAVRTGLDEARRLDTPVLLVHVVPDYVPLTPMLPLAGPDLTETGAAILRGVVAEVAAQAPDLHVDSELRHGPRAMQLVTAAHGAVALYVGRDDRPLLERVLLGNTAAGAASRATCPVVVVPPGWAPQGGGVAARGVVVVAVKSPAHSTELLADAFAAAATHGARLVVLHSWKLPSGYDDIVAAGVATDELTQRSTAELETLLHEWRTTFPAVQVEIRIVHDQPAQALVRASHEADLLVLVRHAHGFPAGTLGGTGRAVLRDADCPVRVVPPGPVSAVAGLVLEEAGDISK
ncbi:MAG: universal stress protein [Nocardioides sp.]|nr:universal stress protein [Nocardioides sp.]